MNHKQVRDLVHVFSRLDSDTIEEVADVLTGMIDKVPKKPAPEWPGEGGHCQVWNVDKKPLHPAIYECGRTQGIFLRKDGVPTNWSHWSPITVLKDNQIALDVVEYTGHNAPVGKRCWILVLDEWHPYKAKVSSDEQWGTSVTHYAVMP